MSLDGGIHYSLTNDSNSISYQIPCHLRLKFKTGRKLYIIMYTYIYHPIGFNFKEEHTLTLLKQLKFNTKYASFTYVAYVL